MEKKKEVKKVKQPELKGMPPKGDAEKAAESFVSGWEDYRTAVSNYKLVVKAMSDFAEKNLGIQRITVVDSIGIKRTIRISRLDKVNIRIAKAKKDE
jgi:hypothetical protein